MSEKRMLIVPAELVKRIDENRGDMKQADFIDFIIESHLKQDSKEQQNVNKDEFVSKDEFQGFEQSIKGLLRNFIEFFTSYAFELGLQPMKSEFGELDHKLDGLEGAFTVRKQGKAAKIEK